MYFNWLQVTQSDATHLLLSALTHDRPLILAPRPSSLIFCINWGGNFYSRRDVRSVSKHRCSWDVCRSQRNSVSTSSWLLLVIQLHTNVERLSSCGVSSDTVERTQPSSESSVETNTLNCDVSRSGASVASTLGTTVPVMSDKILAWGNSLTRVKK